MRNLLLFYLAMLLASCSTPTHRTIENPHIEMANSHILDIRHIELTDTATILSFEAFGGPGQPIKLNEKTKTTNAFALVLINLSILYPPLLSLHVNCTILMF